MNTNDLPKLNMKDNPTGCCPRFLPEEWNEKTFKFDNKPFVMAKTINFLHIPLNLGSVITATWKKITEAGAYRDGEFVILSYDASLWSAEHYFLVSKSVPGANNVTLSGTFVTKVFEGPYQDAGKWHQEMIEYVKQQGNVLKKIYFYYTTCPKCAKTYGKNYTVAFAEVER